MDIKAPGHLINIISNKVKRLADENLINENVTIEQVKIMAMIHRNGGTVSQKEIELAFGVRRSTVTSAMQILEKKGYIERSSNPDDSRSKLVTLTKEGVKKNEKLRSFMTNLEEKLLEGISKSDRETLMRLLEKVLENIERERN